MKDSGKMRAFWVIRRFRNDEDFLTGQPKSVEDATGRMLPAQSEIDFNLLLNEGITALLNLLIGNAETNFGNSNAYLGVGDDNTAESAAQTGLVAATNKLYKAMEASYPQISGQGATWRSVFGSSDANFDWNEFTVANGNSDAADNLNRKVSAQGTKASGQTWTLDLTITFS